MSNLIESPRLMHDSTENDGKAEIVMDYVLSWSLRWAESKYINVKPILAHYCRFMLSKLIDKEITDDTNVISVKVWKEWARIDLTVEVIINNNDSEEKHAILIENKYYSKLHDNQLVKYNEAFLCHYKETEEWTKHYKLLSCLDTREDVDRVFGEELKGTDFSAYSFYELLDPTFWQKEKGEYILTESDIFNEFWLLW
jgi:hypothetical protein